MPSFSPSTAATGAVLIVDDDPEIRECIQRILEEEGYDVRTAENGQRALDRIEEQRPDVVLLDLNMPVMSGWQLQQRLREQELRIPLIFMTAATNARAEAERHHADGFLPKPFELNHLVQTVARFAPASA